MRYAVALVFAAGFVSLHLLIGGTRLGFAIPCFAALALASLLAAGARREPDAARGLAPWAALLFFATIAGRAAVSPFPYLAWPDLTAAVACLVVYLFASRVLVEAKLRLAFLALLVVLALFDFGIGGRQFRFGDDWMPFGFLRPEDYRGRASGAFICPNHLAGYLNAVALFAFAAACWMRRGRAWRLLAAYCGLVCVVGLILTGSRGGFLSLGCGLVVLLALALHRRFEVAGSIPLRPVLIGVAALAVAAGIGVLAVSQSVFLSARADRLVDLQDIRLRLWRAAWQQFQLEPLTGTGAGTYLIYGRTFREGVSQDPIHVHNDYLHLAAEYGALGMLAAGFFVGAHAWAGWRTHRRLLGRKPMGSESGSNSVALNQGALAAAAAVAAHSVVDFNLHIPSNALLYAWVAGILAAGGGAGRNPAGWLVEGFWRIVTLAGGLWLGWFSWQHARGEWHAERARVAVRDGEAVVAIREARAGLETESENPWLHFHLGDARWLLAQKAGNPAAGRSFAVAALEAYTAAARLSPLDSRILLQQAWVASLLGRADEAGERFARALEVDPRNAGIWRALGHHFRRIAQPEAAARAYRRAVELTGDPEAKANLEDLAKPVPSP